MNPAQPLDTPARSVARGTPAGAPGEYRATAPLATGVERLAPGLEAAAPQPLGTWNEYPYRVCSRRVAGRRAAPAELMKEARWLVAAPLPDGSELDRVS
jgi:hypothetical protein